MSVESRLTRLSSDLHNISLTTGQSPSTKSKGTKKKIPVADSWEDDASDAESQKSQVSEDSSIPVEAPGPDIKSPTTLAQDAEKYFNGGDVPEPPPPTPISPTLLGMQADWSPAQTLGGGRPISMSLSSSAASTPRNPNAQGAGRRPEKTTATANRLIAGALGIKAPPKTAEQRQYDRAVRENEMKRRNREKAVKEKETEDEEKAKADVWNS